MQRKIYRKQNFWIQAREDFSPVGDQVKSFHLFSLRMNHPVSQYQKRFDLK